MKVGDIIEYKDNDGDYLLGEVVNDDYDYCIIKVYKCIDNSGLIFPKKKYRIEENSMISSCCKIIGSVYDKDFKEKIMVKCL